MKENSGKEQSGTGLFMGVFLAGFLIGAIGVALISFFDTQLVVKIAVFGSLLMVSSLVGFQVAMTANIAGPGVELADMKNLWFWLFYAILFPVIDLVFLIASNHILEISATRIGLDNLFSWGVFKEFSPYLAIFYLLLTVTGLIWRHKKRT